MCTLSSTSTVVLALQGVCCSVQSSTVAAALAGAPRVPLQAELQAVEAKQRDVKMQNARFFCSAALALPKALMRNSPTDCTYLHCIGSERWENTSWLSLVASQIKLNCSTRFTRRPSLT